MPALPIDKLGHGCVFVLAVGALPLLPLKLVELVLMMHVHEEPHQSVLLGSWLLLGGESEFCLHSGSDPLISQNLFPLKNFLGKADFDLYRRVLSNQAVPRVAVINEKFLVANEEHLALFDVAGQAALLKERFQHVGFERPSHFLSVFDRILV